MWIWRIFSVTCVVSMRPLHNINMIRILMWLFTRYIFIYMVNTQVSGYVMCYYCRTNKIYKLDEKVHWNDFQNVFLFVPFPCIAYVCFCDICLEVIIRYTYVTRIYILYICGEKENSIISRTHKMTILVFCCYCCLIHKHTNICISLPCRCI